MGLIKASIVTLLPNLLGWDRADACKYIRLASTGYGSLPGVCKQRWKEGRCAGCADCICCMVLCVPEAAEDPSTCTDYFEWLVPGGMHLTTGTSHQSRNLPIWGGCMHGLAPDTVAAAFACMDTHIVACACMLPGEKRYAVYGCVTTGTTRIF